MFVFFPTEDLFHYIATKCNNWKLKDNIWFKRFYPYNFILLGLQKKKAIPLATVSVSPHPRPKIDSCQFSNFGSWKKKLHCLLFLHFSSFARVKLTRPKSILQKWNDVEINHSIYFFIAINCQQKNDYETKRQTSHGGMVV